MFGYPLTCGWQFQLYSSEGCNRPKHFALPQSQMIGNQSKLRGRNQLSRQSYQGSKFVCVSRVPDSRALLKAHLNGKWAKQRSTVRGPVPTRAVGSYLSMPILKDSVSSYFTTAIEHGILGATMRGSLRLGLIFMIVGWLLNRERLPESTGQVLSKVAFNLCIPAMLFTRVAQVLVAQNDLMLLWIPVSAIIQVLNQLGYCVL